MAQAGERSEMTSGGLGRAEKVGMVVVGLEMGWLESNSCDWIIDSDKLEKSRVRARRLTERFRQRDSEAKLNYGPENLNYGLLWDYWPTMANGLQLK